jgi:signal transduction histidine kinase
MLKRGPEVRASLSVNELIEEVEGLVREDLQSEQIFLQLQLDKKLSSVLGDRVQLQQVLLNLVSNTIDAMREVRDRPRELRISTEAMAPNEVLTAVSDSGVGINPKDADRIFEAFFTTKANGMGLGLSICRSIIEAHGGRLWASQGSPSGSVFKFTLPCEGGAR